MIPELAFPRSASAITPHDTNEQPFDCGLWVGGAGDVSVRMRDGMDAVFSAVPAGTLLPINVVRVRTTGTTATLLVGLRSGGPRA